MVAAPPDDDIEMGSGGSFGGGNWNMGIRFVNSFDDIDSEEDEIGAEFEERMRDVRNGLGGLGGLKQRVHALIASEKSKILKEVPNMKIE